MYKIASCPSRFTILELTQNTHNGGVLQKIADDEHTHVLFWRDRTGRQVKPYRFKLFKFFWIARLLGLTFGIKLLERDEAHAQRVYKGLAYIVTVILLILPYLLLETYHLGEDLQKWRQSVSVSHVFLLGAKIFFYGKFWNVQKGVLSFVVGETRELFTSLCGSRRF